MRQQPRGAQERRGWLQQVAHHLGGNGGKTRRPAGLFSEGGEVIKRHMYRRLSNDTQTWDQKNIVLTMGILGPKTRRILGPKHWGGSSGQHAILYFGSEIP